MYGDIGTKLVQHAKRTLALPALPPYQTDFVLSCTRETVSLNKECDALLAPLGGHFSVTEDPALGATLVVNHACMRRNKRCLLAYHKIRTDKLEEAMWRGEDVLETPTNTTPLWSERNLGRGNNINTGNQAGDTQDMNGDQQQNNLSPEEEEYVRGYGELLAEYKGMWTDIDLTGSLEPPRDLFIDVRVLKDAGEIQTEYGSITLTKNSQFYVRQGDVERLIAQGYLQKLS